MQRKWLTLAAIAVLLGAAPTFAQGFLDQLEGVLDAEAKAAARRPEPADERQPGYLGLLAVEDRGKVRVESVKDASAASGAGIHVGDVITAIDGRPIRSLDEMGEALAGRFAGDRVVIALNRDDRKVIITTALGAKVNNADIADLPPEPDPFAPDVPAAEAPADARIPERAPPADVPVDALDALRTLEALLDEEAPDALPERLGDPHAKDATRKKRISALETELEAIQRRMSELENEIRELAE